MMKNPATAPQDKLNDFTRMFSDFDKTWSQRTSNFWVVLRDGTRIRPYYNKAEHHTETDCFYGELDGRLMFCWNLDGTSVTSRDYDMVRLEWTDE
jgi:hypothetical protein